MDMDKSKQINQKILFVLMLFSLVGVANAIGFSDDFTGYNSSYQILSYTDSSASTGRLFDANAPFFTSIIADSNSGMTVPIDVSLNGSNSGFVDQNFPVVNISDYNTQNGRVRINVIFTDLNSDNTLISFPTVTNFTLRIGQNILNYAEYKVLNFGTINGTEGKQTLSMDLNSTTAIVGTPDFTTLNWFQAGFVYGATTQDFNYTLNKLWVERYPNGFSGTWNVPTNGVFYQGTSLPFTYAIQGSGMSLFDSNKSSLRKMGIVLLPGLDSYDSRKFSIVIQADLNQVDTNQTKLLFNYVDQNNFSSCYIYDINSGGRKIGIEQVVNNVVSKSEVDRMFNYNTTQTLGCAISGTSVAVSLNGTQLSGAAILSSLDGSFGLMSFDGRTMIDNYSITLTPYYVYPIIANNPVVQTTQNAIFPILIVALIGAAIILALLAGTKGAGAEEMLMYPVIAIAVLIILIIIGSFINGVV